MNGIKTIYTTTMPEMTDVGDSFKFSTIHPDGTFQFKFRFLNGRWNCWATLPGGDVREAGVYPNVISWSGFSDYGLVFLTDLDEIDKTSIPLVEVGIITWSV